MIPAPLQFSPGISALDGHIPGQVLPAQKYAGDPPAGPDYLADFHEAAGGFNERNEFHAAGRKAVFQFQRTQDAVHGDDIPSRSLGKEHGIRPKGNHGQQIIQAENRSQWIYADHYFPAASLSPQAADRLFNQGSGHILTFRGHGILQVENQGVGLGQGNRFFQRLP